MNWNLISKDKNGETKVNIFWAVLLIEIVSFLVGVGFFMGKTFVDYVFGNDGYYIYLFFHRYWGIILLVVIISIIVFTERGKEKT